MKLFFSSESKYNMLPFGIRISSIGISRATHLYIVSCLQQNFRRKSVQNDLILNSEGFRSVFQNALVSVQPSSAEELSETAVKSWKRRFFS